MTSDRELYLVVHTLPQADSPDAPHVYAELTCASAGLVGRANSAGGVRAEVFVLGRAAPAVPSGVLFVVHPVKEWLLQVLRGDVSS